MTAVAEGTGAQLCKTVVAEGTGAQLCVTAVVEGTVIQIKQYTEDCPKQVVSHRYPFPYIVFSIYVDLCRDPLRLKLTLGAQVHRLTGHGPMRVQSLGIGDMSHTYWCP
jgi:hypothetical protein